MKIWKGETLYQMQRSAKYEDLCTIDKTTQLILKAEWRLP